MRLLAALACAALGLTAAPAAAQTRQAEKPVLVVAVPPLATPSVENTPAGTTWAIANYIADLIASDLEWSQRFVSVDTKSIRPPSYPEVTAPSYATWRRLQARALVSGFVEARPDGRLAIGCYLYDLHQERELARTGFLVAPTDWRRAAHRCADTFFTQFTGSPGLFQTRVAYVAQSGSPNELVKRIAVQGLDGSNHRYLTAGDATVLTPRWSPKGDKLAYTSFSGGQMHVRIIDVATADDRPLISDGGMSFAPTFSPDGRRVLFSRPAGSSIDLHVVDFATNAVSRLTTAVGSDISASFSPDGERIVFESDRSGSQQIYVMNADGSNERRISFGRGGYASPRWSPDGEQIAFTKLDQPIRRIGVMRTDGSDERVLTAGPSDEGPSWGPSGEHLMFQRTDPASRRTGVFTVSTGGGEARPVTTPQDGSDPAWSRL